MLSKEMSEVMNTYIINEAKNYNLDPDKILFDDITESEVIWPDSMESNIIMFQMPIYDALKHTLDMVQDIYSLCNDHILSGNVRVKYDQENDLNWSILFRIFNADSFKVFNAQVNTLCEGEDISISVLIPDYYDGVLYTKIMSQDDFINSMTVLQDSEANRTWEDD